MIKVTNDDNNNEWNLKNEWSLKKWVEPKNNDDLKKENLIFVESHYNEVWCGSGSGSGTHFYLLLKLFVASIDVKVFRFDACIDVFIMTIEEEFGHEAQAEEKHIKNKITGKN